MGGRGLFPPPHPDGEHSELAGRREVLADVLAEQGGLRADPGRLQELGVRIGRRLGDVFHEFDPENLLHQVPDAKGIEDPARVRLRAVGKHHPPPGKIGEHPPEIGPRRDDFRDGNVVDVIEIFLRGHAVIAHEPAQGGPELPQVVLPHSSRGLRVHLEPFLHEAFDPCVHDPPQAHFRRIERVVQVEDEQRFRRQRYSPPTAISDIANEGAPTFPNQRKSDPAPVTCRRRERMFPETANPRTGSFCSPLENRIPAAPTEKSPDIGSAVWIPRNSERRIPVPACRSSSSGVVSPGARKRLEIPTAGGDLGEGRRQLAVVPVPSFLPQNESAKNPFSTPRSTSATRRQGEPSPSNACEPLPCASRGSSQIPTFKEAISCPCFPASIDLPLATWEARKEGISTSSSSAAAAFSRTAA